MLIKSYARESLLNKIAGELVFSRKPEITLKKWRETFNLTKAQTAKKLCISSSVISDYESGRRIPGTRFIKKFVEGIISYDEEKGGRILEELLRLSSRTSDAIMDMKEFPIPVKASQICQSVKGVSLSCKEQLDRKIYGYTIVDSIKAIQTLSGMEFYQLFGSTTERAAIFTNVTNGRSPLVAVRVHPLKPKMIIIQGPKEVDAFAIQLAELERIPLILSKIAISEDLVNALKALHRRNVKDDF